MPDGDSTCAPRGQDIEVLTIGTELLLGFTIDTNAAYLGQLLSDAGIRVVRRSTIGDQPEEIRSGVASALERCGFVITTGGLGPTRDDISRQVVSDLLEVPLEFNESVWQSIVARYARRGAVAAEGNRAQAMVPRGASVLPNQWGTAPGLWIESSRGTVVMLPGVPSEMRMLALHEVLPRMDPLRSGTVIRSATVRTNGVPESTLAERIGDLEDRLAPLSLAYLPGTAGVDLRLTAWNLEIDRATEMLSRGTAELRAIAGESYYGEGNVDLAETVVARLRSLGYRIAVAESCTGGLLGGRITDVAGASAVFVGGVIAYDNAVKRDVLDVPAQVIDTHGAVSEESARAMAAGAAARFGSEVAISITGIAGPDGGTVEKPVGTIWFGFAVSGKVDTHRSIFGGARAEIRERAVLAALMGVLKRLGGADAARG